jgi:hypothetical protein
MFHPHPFLPIRATADGSLFHDVGEIKPVVHRNSHAPFCSDEMEHRERYCKYHKVTSRFKVNGEYIRVATDQLVLECFGYYIPGKLMVIKHKDDNVKNNAIQNLMWCYI